MEFQRRVGKVRALVLFGLGIRSYFKFIGHDRIQSVRDVAPGCHRMLRGVLCAWNRPAVVSRRCEGTPGVHCPLPHSHKKKTIHPPPVQSHTWRPCEKRRKIKEKGDTLGKVERVLRENPCHCLYRREEVLESVNSFRGNKHGC